MIPLTLSSARCFFLHMPKHLKNNHVQSRLRQLMFSTSPLSLNIPKNAAKSPFVPIFGGRYRAFKNIYPTANFSGVIKWLHEIQLHFLIIFVKNLGHTARFCKLCCFFVVKFFKNFPVFKHSRFYSVFRTEFKYEIRIPIWNKNFL